MSKTPSIFSKEADLCAAFIAAIPKEWTAYPETDGWDILLVRHGDGCQIGIEAKLKLNVKVLLQAIEDSWDRPGPDYRACLVPYGQAGELASIAEHCCLTVITMRKPPETKYIVYPLFSPGLPDSYPQDDNRHWFDRLPTKRCRVPEYVPDVQAGVSAPVQLTRWKIAAIRVSILLEETGFLTRADFKEQALDIRRWTESRWLLPQDGVWVRGERYPDFRASHPRNWEEIKADVTKWSRKAVAMKQQPLMEFVTP